MEGISLFSKFRLLIYFKCRAGSFKIVYLNWMWPQLCSFGSIFTASSDNIKAALGKASAPNSEMLLLFGLSRQLLLWLIQMSLSFKPLIILQVCYHQFLFVFFSKLVINLLWYLRYGVEPPVLVKLEKEIELEETLLMTSGPPSPISTPKSCCHHGELHEAVSATCLVWYGL